MKHVAFFLFWAFCVSCTPSDPLDRKYDKAQGIKALIDDNGQPVIDSIQVTYVITAETENEVQGRPNEQFTYRQLMLQGREIMNQKRYEMYDR